MWTTYTQKDDQNTALEHLTCVLEIFKCVLHAQHPILHVRKSPNVYIVSFFSIQSNSNNIIALII